MSDERRGVYIEGVAIDIEWADATKSLTELIFGTVRRAVDEGGQPLEAIDSVVIACHDMVDGRSLSSMVTGPAAGSYLRDEIRYSDDGAVAFAAATARIEARESERSIVAAWGRASEFDVEAVGRAVFDRFISEPLGLDELQVAALRAQRWIQRGGDLSARGAANNRRAEAAQNNPRALRTGGRVPSHSYPLHSDEMPRWADISVAITLSSTPTRVRVAGMGQASEAYSLGERQLEELSGLRIAAARALSEAGWQAQDLDVVELDGLTLLDEAIATEAVGLAANGAGLSTLARDRRCNPSGGGAAGYCAPAMGLLRIAEAALQLSGRAGPVQIPKARKALATGSHLLASQTHTAIALEAL